RLRVGALRADPPCRLRASPRPPALPRDRARPRRSPPTRERRGRGRSRDRPGRRPRLLRARAAPRLERDAPGVDGVLDRARGPAGPGAWGAQGLALRDRRARSRRRPRFRPRVLDDLGDLDESGAGRARLPAALPLLGLRLAPGLPRPLAPPQAAAPLIPPIAFP